MLDNYIHMRRNAAQMQSQDISPYSQLVQQEQDILSFAHGLPSQERATPSWVGMSFLSGDFVLLTPLAEIVEILPVPALAPIPSVKPWLRGIGNCRQELFPITDLSAFLGMKDTFISKHSRVLMMNYHDGYCGLLVDKVLGLQRISHEHVKTQAKDSKMNGFDPFTVGVFANARIELPIVSLQSIIALPRFQDAALKQKEIAEERE